MDNIRPSTVLILGAGASEPYGFPLGKTLRTDIIQALGDPKDVLWTTLITAGFTPEKIAEFRDTMETACYETIDDFLNARSETFREIGAYAIVVRLMSLEQKRDLGKRNGNQSRWYPLLLELLGIWPRGERKIDGIITFNYDRSVEHYLWQNADDSFHGENRLRVESVLRACPIIHLHGALGKYPDHPYEFRGEIERINEAVESLKITSDSDLDESPVYREAQSILGPAQQVIFLGVGYHRQSLERLGFLNPEESRKLFGTAVQISGKKQKHIAEMFSGKIYLDRLGHSIFTFLNELTMAG